MSERTAQFELTADAVIWFFAPPRIAARYREHLPFLVEVFAERGSLIDNQVTGCDHPLAYKPTAKGKRSLKALAAKVGYRKVNAAKGVLCECYGRIIE